MGDEQGLEIADLQRGFALVVSSRRASDDSRAAIDYIGQSIDYDGNGGARTVGIGQRRSGPQHHYSSTWSGFSNVSRILKVL
jgi:hypothetical protein